MVNGDGYSSGDKLSQKTQGNPDHAIAESGTIGCFLSPVIGDEGQEEEEEGEKDENGQEEKENEKAEGQGEGEDGKDEEDRDGDEGEDQDSRYTIISG